MRSTGHAAHGKRVLITVARRRRRIAANQRRAGVVAASAVALHAFLIATLPGPSSRGIAVASYASSGERDHVESLAVAGGVFDVDVDCTADAAQAAFARMVICQLEADAEVRACMHAAMADYRIARVDCSTPDDTMAAELDATELIVDDTLPPIELEMLDIAEQIIEEAEEEIAERNAEGQVVDFAPPIDQEEPEDADYLAEFNSNPEKETKKSGTPGASVIPLERQPNPDKDPDVAPAPAPPDLGQAGEEQPGRGGALAMRSEGTPGEPAIERPETGRSFGFERMTESGIGAIRGVSRSEPLAPEGSWASDSAGVGKTGLGTMPHNLRLSQEAYDRSAGGTNDHLPDVEYGDFTSLRARKWKYASFFNRVKRQVAQNWNPEAAYRMRDPNGNVYGTKDRLTVLQVSLTPEGALAKVLVSEPSGVDFLDDEAIKAFRAAEPFPNPPRGLIDAESRLITFRFGFSFEINSSTPWKVFRYRN